MQTFEEIFREFDKDDLTLNIDYFDRLSAEDRELHFRIALAVLDEEIPTDDPWPASSSVQSLSRVLTRPDGQGDIKILQWARGPENLALSTGEVLQLPENHMGAVVEIFYMDTHAVCRYYIQVPPELLDERGRILTSDYRLLGYHRPGSAD